MRKQLNSSIPEQLIKQIDKIVKNSKGIYRDRSHFVQLAIREKIEKIID